MSLHPQIAALAGQMEELAAFLRSRGERHWSGRVDLCAHLVADSNFAGVDRFLRLFAEEDGLDSLVLQDEAANARLVELRRAARHLAERLAKEEGAAHRTIDGVAAFPQGTPVAGLEDSGPDMMRESMGSLSGHPVAE